MHWIAHTLLPYLLTGVTTIAGTVVNPQGEPISDAQVFIEPGLTGALRTTTTDDNGHFRFGAIAPGAVGLFAHAPGFAFSGEHINVAVADELPPKRIVLRRPGSLSGRVTDGKRPVTGARVMRVAIHGETTVAIPLAKLAARGYKTPVTDADGRFTVDHLPENATVDLKVGHPEYALEGATGARVGDADFDVTLYRGTLLRGEVITRGDREPVVRAAVTVRNAQPPYSSAFAETDAFGQFSFRVKPGVYTYKAEGAGMRSAGAERLVVTPDGAPPRLQIIVSGTGEIRGEVKDAVSGAPIGGARIDLYTGGRLAAISRTGATGEYRFGVAQGEYVVRLGLAAGYRSAGQEPVRLYVKEDEVKKLPGYWLVPLPQYSVEVFAEDGETPAPDAVVSLLRPRQLGWQRTDAVGRARIFVADLPEDGRLLGLVHHLHEPMGALFEFKTGDADTARVQLLPLSTITGQVMGIGENPRPGAVAGGVYSDEAYEDPIPLWRTVSGPDGRFQWDAVLAGVPQAAYTGSGTSATFSDPFNLPPRADHEVGTLVLHGPPPRPSLHGERMRWHDYELLGGTVPDRETRAASRTLLLFVEPGEADAAVEVMQAGKDLLDIADLEFAVAVSGAYEAKNPRIPVVLGARPGIASTYLLDAEDRVVMETFGLPAPHLLRGSTN